MSTKATLQEILDRTTILPGEQPLISHPRMGFVIDALFALRADPHDRTARMQLALLHKEGAGMCQCCGDDVILAGFRRTKTSYAVRDEYRCGCGQRYLLAAESIC